MNHYDTLGVPQDATADDIKQAFRRASMKAHLDRGGSEEQQQAVNRAYEVLADPQRRARYDAGQGDGQPVPIEVEARNALLQVFASALNEDGANVITRSREIMAKEKQRLSQGIFDCRRKRNELELRRARIKSKHDENLAHMLIDQQVAQLTKMIDEAEHSVKVAGMVEELLNFYDDETPVVMTMTTMNGGIGSFWGAANR